MNDDIQRFLQDIVSDANSVTIPGGAEGEPGRPKWLGWALVGGAVALVVALIVAFAASSDDDEVATTETTVPATTVVVTAEPVTTGVATTVATVVPTTEVPTTIPSDVAPLAPLESEPAPTAVTAGADGVWVVAGTERVQWVTEPVARAVMTDGGLIVQRRSGWGSGSWPSSDTALLRVSEPGAVPEPFLAGTDWGAEPFLVLHDAAVLDQGPTLLVEVATEQVNIESPAGRLLAVNTIGDTASLSVLDDGFGGWESGSSRMHLGRTGLVVGELFSEVVRSIAVYSVGSGPAPTAGELGLEESYVDCSDCPRNYTVSRDGTTIAWLDGNELVRYDVGGDGVVAGRPRIDLGARAGSAGELSIADGAVVLDQFERAPDLVTFRDGLPVATPLSGSSATFGADFATTPWVDASGDFPDGVVVDLLGRRDSSLGVLQRIRQLVEQRPDECSDRPRQITRLDDTTLRVRLGCDDSGGGIDYRFTGTEPLGRETVRATVVRRTICLRGVSDGLCV